MTVLMIFVAIPATFYLIMLMINGGTPTSRMLKEPGPKQFDAMRTERDGVITYYIDHQSVQLIPRIDKSGEKAEVGNAH